MKATGIVRKVDELGRVVLPIELRRNLGIAEKDPMEIFVEGENIILRKYEVANKCMLTGEVSEDNISLAEGKIVLSPTGLDMLLYEIKKKAVAVKGR